jgi:hypothetical protein
MQTTAPPPITGKMSVGKCVEGLRLELCRLGMQHGINPHTWHTCGRCRSCSWLLAAGTKYGLWVLEIPALERVHAGRDSFMYIGSPNGPIQRLKRLTRVGAPSRRCPEQAHQHQHEAVR